MDFYFIVPFVSEENSPILADFAAKIGAVPVNGYICRYRDIAACF
jgi:hypothetical protein